MEREELYNVGKSIFLDLPNVIVVEQRNIWLHQDVENLMDRRFQRF